MLLRKLQHMVSLHLRFCDPLGQASAIEFQSLEKPTRFRPSILGRREGGAL